MLSRLFVAVLVVAATACASEGVRAPDVDGGADADPVAIARRGAGDARETDGTTDVYAPVAPDDIRPPVELGARLAPDLRPAPDAQPEALALTPDTRPAEDAMPGPDVQVVPGDVQPARPDSGWCYDPTCPPAGFPCDPVGNVGCGVGERCGRTGLDAPWIGCIPDGKATLGQACNQMAQDTCAPGLWCHKGRCARMCPWDQVGYGSAACADTLNRHCLWAVKVGRVAVCD